MFGSLGKEMILTGGAAVNVRALLTVKAGAETWNENRITLTFNIFITKIKYEIKIDGMNIWIKYELY